MPRTALYVPGDRRCNSSGSDGPGGRICRPKTTTPDDIHELASALDEPEPTALRAPIIEDAAAVLAAREIA